ncbi:MAG: hypothetical protein JWN39_1202, partial [Ilumatobacteraceae bacterium]|nr:hypothetical protein [Ilumatobacteraceae bacterium]
CAQEARSFVSGTALQDIFDEMSVFDRSTDSELSQAGESPLRLRTLSTVLKAPSDRADDVREAIRRAGPTLLGSQLVPPGQEFRDDSFLSTRLDLVADSLASRTGLPVRIVTEAESDVEQRGRERFSLLLDVLTARDESDVAEALEYVSWLPEREQLVVSAPNRTAAGRLIGKNGLHLRKLIDELPLLGIHVDVVAAP